MAATSNEVIPSDLVKACVDQAWRQDVELARP